MKCNGCTCEILHHSFNRIGIRIVCFSPLPNWEKYRRINILIALAIFRRQPSNVFSILTSPFGCTCKSMSTIVIIRLRLVLFNDFSMFNNKFWFNSIFLINSMGFVFENAPYHHFSNFMSNAGCCESKGGIAHPGFVSSRVWRKIRW